MLHQALVQRPCSCIRRLSGGVRAREIRITRWLRNRRVTPAEIFASASAATAARAIGRDVLVTHDTSELALGGRRARDNGFGPVGGGGALGGLLLHPLLALDAGTGQVLGLVDATIWNREGGLVTPRRSRAASDKESQRWLAGAQQAGRVLAGAAQITVVADRESDMYEVFARHPSNVHMLVRVAQDRLIEASTHRLLFAFIDSLPEQGDLDVTIPAAPGRKARTTKLAVRFSAVKLRKPRNGAARDLPETVTLTLVDVRETVAPEQGEPIHWRLATTHSVANPGEAHRIVDLYRRRWIIEEFFRTLKTAGFDIEAADIGNPQVMMNLTAAATVAAVTVMQLVQARDGTTKQLLTEAFDPADQPILEAISKNFESEKRLKNPHPKGTLAFAAWVIGRLGCWTGYYGKAGPKVLRRGLDDFQRIKYGTALSLGP